MRSGDQDLEPLPVLAYPGGNTVRHLLAILLILALLFVFTLDARSDTPDLGVVEVLVTAGPTPLPEASVALDLNNNGVWDEHLGEPRGWTDADGLVVFSEVVSIQQPGDGADPMDSAHDWRPSRIMMGNVRGSVGAQDVQVDFLLPAGSGPASLGLYDLRGRRLSQTHGAGDLALSLPGGLPSGVYFLRLGAEPAAPVSQRITSVGVGVQTIRARQVSVAEAVAAGWVESRPLGQGKRHEDPPHPINLIVEHGVYPTVIQPEVIEPGSEHFFTVDMVTAAPEGFMYIPPGTFMMGSPEDEPGRESREGPQHQVTLTQGFYMSRYEVTEQWWHLVMGGTPGNYQLPEYPVSWDMAVQFCNELSLQEGLTPAYTIHGPAGDVTWHKDADGFRLPTEAEWEYACRAGSTTAFANGPLTGSVHCSPVCDNLDAMGWYCGNRTYVEGPAMVGQKQANEWGLYDMHGNVWEWVWCGLRDYTEGAVVDPVYDVEPGAYRVFRGGLWCYYAEYCRSAKRSSSYPGSTYITGLGFRPVRSAFESP